MGDSAIDGAELIVRERRRQVDCEGWDEWHDAQHRSGELARAAAWYALSARLRRGIDANRRVWPRAWAIRWRKPTPDDRVRELVKAGALIAAEIDRLQRARRDG